MSLLKLFHRSAHYLLGGIILYVLHLHHEQRLFSQQDYQERTGIVHFMDLIVNLISFLVECECVM